MPKPKRRLELTQSQLLDVWECVSEILEQELEDTDIVPGQLARQRRLKTLERTISKKYLSGPDVRRKAHFAEDSGT